MNRFSKHIARSLLIGLIFVLLAGSLHAVWEAGHTCTGCDCPVCMQLAACKSLVIGLLGIGAPLLIGSRVAVLIRAVPCGDPPACTTPVSLCVRLSE